MKSTSRVRLNIATKPKKQQSEIKHQKARAARLRQIQGTNFQMPKGVKESHCLATFDRANALLCYRVPLSEEEFSALWKFCLQTTPLKPNIPFRPEVTLASVIRRGMAASADCGWSELEINVTKVAGLLQLLSEKLDHIRTDASEFSGADADKLCAGINFLVADAKKTLRMAFDTTFHAIHGSNQR